MPLSRPLSESVVVVTGASSGIGAATALRLAERGAAVVLAARRTRALVQIAEACRAGGGQAIAVATDVTDADAVEALAARAVTEFGRLDGWVNNAAVATYGRFADLPIEELRRVIETNLLGVAYGCRSALPRLSASGGGVIVNVASVLAEVALPYMAPYNASKHAVRGLADTLRQELTSIGDTDIDVCTVLPAAVDTPFYRHAANHTGRPPQPPPPAYRPGRVARTIVRLLEQPRREAYVGGAGRAIGYAWRFAPSVAEPLLARYAARAEFAHGGAVPTQGNVFTPTDDDAEIRGGFPAGSGGLIRAFGATLTRRIGTGSALGLALLGTAAMAAGLVRVVRR